MTDILSSWLNQDLTLSQNIEGHNFLSSFSNGYLIGEILSKYQLQDDFNQFSQSFTADSKLKNFTLLEPTLHLLGVQFDSNIARDIMTEKPGVVTRLLYQLFIALEKKKKSNLTGVAMETMRPAAPAKLQSMESVIYKERLKQLTPRQTDLNLQQIVERFHQHQTRMEERALKARIESADNHLARRDQHREERMDKSKEMRLQQSELMAKIEAAVVQIPKPPPNRTAKALEEKKYLKRRLEAENSRRDLDLFDERLKQTIGSAPTGVDNIESDEDEEMEEEAAMVSRLPVSAGTTRIEYIKPASNDEYIGRIRKRLEEDNHARVEREKRRRKVLVECLKAHHLQEESQREELLANRLMRQSQMERRITVQLLQARHEKDILKRNRMERERQYQEMREKEFFEALEREKELCRQNRLDYIEQYKKEEEQHATLRAKRQQEKYNKHYKFCWDVVQNMIDFSCKVAEYRDYTEKKVPEILYREWVHLFVASQPLYDIVRPSTAEAIQQSEENIVMDEKAKLLDESEFAEYREMIGEWLLPEDGSVQKPEVNVILGWIVDRLFNIVHPPIEPPCPPNFPPFPIKAAIIGKTFSGKSTVIQQIISNNQCVCLKPDILIQEAIEAFANNEKVEVVETENIEDPEMSYGSLNIQSDGNASFGPPLSTPHEDGEQLVEAESENQLPELTERAKLGEQVSLLLKKGKPVTDDLMAKVVVESIKRLSPECGFIIDGFPTTYNQAKLLEKALTGIDEQELKEAEANRKVPSLTKNPKAKPAKDIKEDRKGLDVVVMLDISDQYALKRALGRTEAPNEGKEYHFEFKPPPLGSATGVANAEKIQPVKDQFHDMEQIQLRLTSYLEGAPKLEKFYQKMGIFTKVNAEQEPLPLYLEVEHILEEAVKKPEPEPELEPAVKETLKVEPVSEGKVETTVKEEGALTDDIIVQAEPLPEPVPEPPKEGEGRSRPASGKGGSNRSGSAKGGKGSKKGSPARSKSGSRSGSADKKEEKKKGGKGSKGSRGSSPKSPKGSRPGSKASKKGSKTSDPAVQQPPPEVEAPPQEEQGPPPPEPGSDDWVYVDQPVPMELANALVPLWSTVETCYIDNCKMVFRQLREEREDIIKYFYTVRTDFMAYLRRPDPKQEFITQFQKEFNDVSNDIRGDEDVMQDLHQRVDDLRDKLFDICDERKQAAEKRREEIVADSWLEDHIGLLTNIYISLMQSEFNKFQDTLRFLKEYYKAMDQPIPDEYKPEFVRLPMIELPVEVVAGDPEVTAAVAESRTEKAASPPAKKAKGKAAEAAPAENEIRELTDAEIEAMFRTRIPLLPPKPSAAEISAAIVQSAPGGGKGKDKPKAPKEKKSDRNFETPPPPSDPDERLLYDAYWSGVQIILNFVTIEQQLKEAEEEAERAKQMEGSSKDKSKDSKDKSGGKTAGGKKDAAPAGKGGKKSRSPSPKKGAGKDTKSGKQEETATTPEPEESEESRQRRELKEKMKKEYFAAIDKEAYSARIRMELVKMIGCAIIHDLKSKAEELHKTLYDWIGAKILKENEAIEQLTEILRYTIETKEKLKEIIELKGEDIFLNMELTPLIKTPLLYGPSPIEPSELEQFKVEQLSYILNRIRTVAPAGLMSTTEFVNFFQDLNLMSQQAELTLPEYWRNITTHQLTEIAEAYSFDKEYVNWRAFLLGISQPWPRPTQNQLLETLARFRDLDQKSTGLVTREQYNFIDLWFAEANYVADVELSNDPVEIKVVTRQSEIKKLFFDIFLEGKSAAKDCNDLLKPPYDSIDFENFLFHFCHSPSSYVGVLRALSVSVENHVPHITLKGSVLDCAVELDHDSSIPEDCDPLIPIESLYKVLRFGQQHIKLGNLDIENLKDDDDKKDVVTPEVLSAIYQQLNEDKVEPLPFTRLIQHSYIAEMLLQAKQFKLIDLKSILSDPEANISKSPAE